MPGRGMCGWAVLPVFLACLEPRFAWRLAHVAIFHALVFVTSGWGLISITGSILAGIGYAAFLLAVSALIAWRSIPLAVVVIALVPWHPAQIALFAPGFGALWTFGVLLVAAAHALRIWMRRLAVGTAAILPVFASIADAPAPPDRPVVVMELRNIPAFSVDMAVEIAVSAAAPGETLVFGENLIDARSRSAWAAQWCRLAEEHDVELYSGVLRRDGASQIWRFGNENGACRARQVYNRVVGIPMVTSGWGFGGAHPEPDPGSMRDIDWMICFEAFVPLRWLGLLRSDRPGPVVIASNDTWLKPTPIDVLREKVGRSWSRLLDRPVLYTTHLDEALLLGASR